MLRTVSYRIKQFYFGMSAQYAKVDEAFVRNYLSDQELSLFYQLPGFEKKHAVVVAKKMLDLSLYNPELDQRKLVKLGLLHDIGKVYERNTVITKSLLVVLRFFFPTLYNWLAEKGETHPALRRYYIHKHHGAVGARMLEEMGEAPEIIMMIKKHDPRTEPLLPDDPIELKILQEADSTY